MVKLTLNITDEKAYRTVRIWFNKELSKLFINKKKQIVIEHFNGILRFREASDLDNNTHNLNYINDNKVECSYSTPFSKVFVGKWEVDIEGDYFVLYKPEIK